MFNPLIPSGTVGNKIILNPSSRILNDHRSIISKINIVVKEKRKNNVWSAVI
jgi:hypothetical protein